MIVPDGRDRVSVRVFGYRPDILATTSVGSVNGFKLAEAAPPPVNDPTAILAAVATGVVDAQLDAMRQLKQHWLAFRAPSDFFEVRPPFKGSLIDEMVRGINTPSFDGPLNVGINEKLTFASRLLGNPNITYGVAGLLVTHPFLAFVIGPLVDSQLQPIRTLIDNVFTENGLLALDPVERKLRNPSFVNLARVAAGTPLFMGAVSLETGKLRYIKGDGAMVERDGVTPVASALTASDINNALAMNGAPLSAAVRQGLTDALAAYAAQVNQIAALKMTFNAATTTLQADGTALAARSSPGSRQPRPRRARRPRRRSAHPGHRRSGRRACSRPRACRSISCPARSASSGLRRRRNPRDPADGDGIHGPAPRSSLASSVRQTSCPRRMR